MKKIRLVLVMVLSVALFVLVGCGEKKPEPKPENAVSLSDFIKEENVTGLVFVDVLVNPFSDLIKVKKNGDVLTYYVDNKNITPTMQNWFTKLDGIYFEKTEAKTEPDYSNARLSILISGSSTYVYYHIYVKKDADGNFTKEVVGADVSITINGMDTMYEILDAKKANSIIDKLITAINKVKPNIE